ncbi:MAG: hypothetical protein KIS79_12730 [Burkholderiales bacterium]|nr:hypothetical protein [Burkholderiales bacterium]
MVALEYVLKAVHIATHWTCSAVGFVAGMVMGGLRAGYRDYQCWLDQD